MSSLIDTNFGTVRGFVRLILDYMGMYAVLYRKSETIDWSSVRRLVFICQGNICRSRYAYWIALRETDAVASLGLNTETYMQANVGFPPTASLSCTTTMGNWNDAYQTKILDNCLKLSTVKSGASGQ